MLKLLEMSEICFVIKLELVRIALSINDNSKSLHKYCFNLGIFHKHVVQFTDPAPAMY